MCVATAVNAVGTSNSTATVVNTKRCHSHLSCHFWYWWPLIKLVDISRLYKWLTGYTKRVQSDCPSKLQDKARVCQNQIMFEWVCHSSTTMDTGNALPQNILKIYNISFGITSFSCDCDYGSGSCYTNFFKFFVCFKTFEVWGVIWMLPLHEKGALHPPPSQSPYTQTLRFDY